MKKLTAFLLAAVLMLTALIPAYAAEPGANEVWLGDFSGDGQINAIDARYCLQAAAGLRTVSASQFARLDVSQDGRIDAIDARHLLQMAVGLRTLYIYNTVTGEITDAEPVIDTSWQTAEAKEVLELVNAERRAAGLGELVLNESLCASAQVRAEEISRVWSHDRPDGSSCFTAITISYRTAGENIAAGYTSSQAVMNGWMNSDGHRRNILNANFTQLGVGCYRDSSGRLNWVQMFVG